MEAIRGFMYEFKRRSGYKDLINNIINVKSTMLDIGMTEKYNIYKKMEEFYKSHWFKYL